MRPFTPPVLRRTAYCKLVIVERKSAWHTFFKKNGGLERSATDSVQFVVDE
jgi:hypothetical protein